MKHPFVWMELRTDDLPKAKKFYSEMFGWELHETPMGEKSVYVMVKGAGASDQFGAGMLANPGKGHVNSHWMPFIGIQDAEAASKKAEKLGGEIIQKPMETAFGIISTVADPTGAAFSLWQEKPKK